MAIPKPCRSYEFTGDILDHDGEFKKFFRGLAEYLKGTPQRVEVKGGRYNYHQYTCGQLHDRRNPEWRKLENLWEYCEEAEFDPYAAIDAIEERIGVKLECDCQIVNNEIENRRKALANADGADLGEAGRDYDFILSLRLGGGYVFFLAFDCVLRWLIKQEFSRDPSLYL